MYASIKPIKFHTQTANRLEVRGCSLGPPPTYYYAFQSFIPGQPEVKDVNGDILVPADLERVETIKDGNVTMPQAIWDAWPIGADDEAYQLQAVAKLVEATLL